ncbi:chitin deacetylase 1 [Cherax quadricarinatus]|uniref:Gastrolith protein n=2 Tax=Cherax quadricarinatus TaxID=27406 RepID=B2YHF7_CHEQU|nr:chitin deacetylase 1-like [Cherax quadricarinatus]ACC97407.1 gastrolith protein [Cherax quadricarinatus]
MIRRVTTPLLALLLAGWVVAQTTDMDPEQYCARRDDEYFRKDFGDPAEFASDYRANCGVYYRCVPAPAGKRSISASQCQSELFFDVQQQICERKSKVTNCEQIDKEHPPQPFWPLREGEESQCKSGEIMCGSGECLPQHRFCDENSDCADGSDENICTPDKDPNRADVCEPRTCLWSQGCFCSVDGTRIPGDLTVDQTPQMITITFTGAINERNFRIFQDVFKDTVKHKGNDCTPKGTFFISHGFSNYSAIQELNRVGHEIAVSSITNNDNPDYWSKLSALDYEAEMDGARLIIEKFANITANEVLGIRVPKQRVGGNRQFRMMVDWGFLYDSSISAPMGRLPLWPYTLMHRMPHKCLGNDQNCPSQNFTVWEMVINEMDRRDDPQFDERLTGCHFVDQCANIQSPEQFRAFLDNNLARHYRTNRAPLGLHFTSGYFETRRDFLREFVKWVRETALSGDYFFVTMQQVINWMEAPTELTAINNFQEWKGKCEVKGQPYCSLPNPCPKKVPRIFPNEEEMFLYTCMECPNTYPWLGDPHGNGFLDIPDF